MELVQPGIGLIFWTTIIFLGLLLILKKFAWKPILNMVNKRNQNIEDALKQAEIAREEMKQLTANNEKILAEARVQSEEILKNAREIKNEMLTNAKEEAIAEMQKIRIAAQRDIEIQREKFIEEMKNQVLELSILMAEKVIQKEINTQQEHEVLVNSLLKNVNFQ